jgi:hypothetical protein
MNSNDKMMTMKGAFQSKIELIENGSSTALSHLQQEQSLKDEENKRLREELEKVRAELNQVTINDLNYDSPEDYDSNYELPDDDDSNYDSPENDDTYSHSNYDSPEDGDPNKDINYDTESSVDVENTTHNTRNSVYQNFNNYVSNEVYADPNYNSSDNEDRTNDICLG